VDLTYKQNCRVCGSKDMTPVIDLGYQYLQGAFVKEGWPKPFSKKLPTQLVRCKVKRGEKGCGLLQMQLSVSPEVLYSQYWYRSGTNATMRAHLSKIAEMAASITGNGKRRVLDIGCNDGTLLNSFPPEFERVGVDPSNISKEVQPPILIVNTFFPSEAATQALAGKKFDIITTIAMFYDLEDPGHFAQNIAEILKTEGVWILEMSYMPAMLMQNAFDTICHEHLEYYSLSVLRYILSKAGLRIFRAELNNINGGSIRCYVTHIGNLSKGTTEDSNYLRKIKQYELDLELNLDWPYREFQERIEAIKLQTNQFITKSNNDGKIIHVYGASTKGNTILQWFGIDSNHIKYASDRNPHKNGARTLGTNIPIVDESTSREMRPDYYFVLPWHFKKEFLLREKKIIEEGTKMIFPLPEFHVVSAENINVELDKASRPLKLF
jgi:SAM-dependent methyltransferase